MTSRRKENYVLCYDCQKPELDKPIDDPQMKAMFNIPQTQYEQSSFLRSIKMNYLRYGKLSEKQIEAFKKVSSELGQNEKPVS